MNRPITDAELTALDALHVWLHQGNGFDHDLIEAAQDFHEERLATCEQLRGQRGVEWVNEEDFE